MTQSRCLSHTSWQGPTVLLEKQATRPGSPVQGRGCGSGDELRHRLVPRKGTARGLAGKSAGKGTVKVTFPQPALMTVASSP